MFATLILWLTWSARSPLRTASGTTTTTPSKPSPDTIKPGPSGTPNADNAPHFPVIPADILGPYTECKSTGGSWDFTANKCVWKG